MKNKVLVLEVIGFVFLIVIGSLIHFAYEWSNNSIIIGVFSPVNESVWEHLKLGFTSLMIFSFIEYFFIVHQTNNFIIAKASGLLILQGFILIFYYSIHLLFKKEILILDILSYVIGCLLCQIVSYKILSKSKLNNSIKYISIFFILLHGLLIIVFTFNPPKLPMFMDNNTGEYGIYKYTQE